MPFLRLLAILLAGTQLPAVPLRAAPDAPLSVAAVRAAAESAAGAPVRLDPRVLIPPCPNGLDYLPQAGAIRISCAATGFALIAPIARLASPAAPLVRRGDLVTVLHEGQGFAVSLEGVAEASATAGQRVAVRNPRSGARFQAVVLPDGRLQALP
jgi:flagella basal body P-ring formation protein FlgA